MRNRPWPLVLIALFQLLSPIGTVFFNALSLQVSPLRVLRWIFQGNPLQIFEAMFLMPIAGLAIFQMKRWSYVVFIVAFGWSAVSNFRQLSAASATHSMPGLIVIYGLQLLLVTYFLLPAVRRTYFDPRVRWWESKPRYVLNLDSRLRLGDGQNAKAKVLNLSEGGVFLQYGQSLRSGDTIRLEFEVLTQTFEVAGKVVHQRELPGTGLCYGVEFVHTEETRQRFRNLNEALALLGFQNRDETAMSWAGFVEWTRRLFTTGDGWQPELGGRGGPKRD